MRSRLLDLPPELTICILCHLNLSSIISLANAYPSIRPIIEDFVSSYYRSATQEAIVDDNQHCNLPTLDRLAILRSRENGWAKLGVDLKRSIPISYDPSNVQRLESGHFIVSEVYGRGFYSCKLPSKASDHTTWSHIKVENFHDVALSIDEHDLAAAVTLPSDSAKRNQPCQIEVKLLQFSTGNPHPLADFPTVILGDSMPPSAIKIDICEDYIGIVCGNVDVIDSLFQDHVFIINWKTGMQRMHIVVSCGSYFDISFLSSELILLPNTRSATLDIWRIPGISSAPPTRPLLILRLPRTASFVLDPCIMLTHDVSRTATNSNRPFHTAPADLLIGIKIIASMFGPLIFVVVHRRALVALLPDNSESTAGVNVIEQHNDRDIITHWDSTTHESDIIRWSEWGPSITRCFSIRGFGQHMYHRTITAGQRCLIGFPSGNASSEMETPPTSFFILDFNPSTVKLALEPGATSYTACTGPNGTVDVLCTCVLGSQLPFAFQRVNFGIKTIGWLFMDEDQIVAYGKLATDARPMLEVFHMGAEADLRPAQLA
ncbi:hypothetical protein Hypma_003494 [Hypsizygus marmoreus]|uniref:F-box domain-containing protein n=1 Tax=Hypsizygus marmoreus TaxID=39966 RepID=A0A369J6G6_HYPMA|nr:hypothetical protein Hypma_004558 [Hypsizygus marmoreus]RDB15995.1 hypothetical protein Hypma_003494 [Hypsizygus marmoreus]